MLVNININFAILFSMIWDDDLFKAKGIWCVRACKISCNQTFDGHGVRDTLSNMEEMKTTEDGIIKSGISVTSGNSCSDEKVGTLGSITRKRVGCWLSFQPGTWFSYTKNKSNALKFSKRVLVVLLVAKT